MVEPMDDRRLAIWRHAAGFPARHVDIPRDAFEALLARLDAAEAERDRLRAEAAAPARGKVSREMVERARRVMHDVMNRPSDPLSDEDWARLMAWERAQGECSGFVSSWATAALAVIAALGLEVEDE